MAWHTVYYLYIPIPRKPCFPRHIFPICTWFPWYWYMLYNNYIYIVTKETRFSQAYITYLHMVSLVLVYLYYIHTLIIILIHMLLNILMQQACSPPKGIIGSVHAQRLYIHAQLQTIAYNTPCLQMQAQIACMCVAMAHLLLKH